MTSGPSVLFWMDDGGDGLLGGNVVQLRETADALRRRGCPVESSTDRRPDLRGVDLVHGFNLSHEHIRGLRRARIPVALSPIYWPYSFRSGAAGPPPTPRARAGRASIAVRSARAALRGRYQEHAHSLLEHTLSLVLAYEAADLLLPNSRLEADAIAAELGVSTPMRVVPNAANPEVFVPAPPGTRREGVVMAGRIEPFKNQLRLIEACKALDVPLTLVGAVHPHHEGYGEACRRQGDQGVRFAGAVSQGELVEILHTAKVHALPSWFETTGLASLEAALAGCAVVTTSRGYASEYFEATARYCDPGSTQSIRNALRTALDEPTPAALEQRVRDRFTWDHTASATLDAYAEILR